MAPVFSPQQIAAISDLMTRGQLPGFGSGQNDTYSMEDNCDAGHGLRLDYVIPGNFQRIMSAKLTIALRAFRAYVSAVNSATSGASSAASSNSSNSVTSGQTNASSSGASSAASSSAPPHVHTWTVSGGFGNPAPTFNLGMTAAGAPLIGPGNPPPFGFQTATETPAGAAAFSAFSTIDSNGAGHSHSIQHLHLIPHDHNIPHTHDIPHTHTVTPSLAYGVFEGSVASGVTATFDGVDQTTNLGGPFNANAVELDVTPYISTTVGALHTILLTPNAQGRVHGILRLTYFCDGRVR